MSVPLKLRDSAAPTELQTMSSSDENYLAYQVGLYLAGLDSSEPSRIGLNSNLENVGSIFNTVYDSDIGTSAGDGGLYSISVTESRVGQNSVLDNNYDSDFRLPIFLDSDNGQLQFKEMDSDVVDAFANKIGNKIFTSDFPGTYKIGSSSPGDDYIIEIPSIATDTTKSGTSNTTYNLYKRVTMTLPPPSSVTPMSIKRSNGDSGDYQGLQQMSTRQLRHGVGHLLKNRIAKGLQEDDSDGYQIGSYIITSSAEGSPASLLGGTWVSKGVVTDTRQEIEDHNYTRTSTDDFLRERVAVTKSSAFTRTTQQNFLRINVTTRESTFTSTYTKTRTCLRSEGFVGDFLGDFTTTTESNFTRDRSEIGNYQRERRLERDEIFTRTSNYAGNFLGNFTRNFSGLVNGNSFYTGPYVQYPTYWSWSQTPSMYGTNWKIFIVSGGTVLYDAFVSPIQAQYRTEQYISSLNKTYYRGVYRETVSGYGQFNYFSTGPMVEGTRSSTYLRDRQGDFSGTRNFRGDFLGDFLGEFTRPLSFQGDFQGERITNNQIVRQQVRPDDFSRNFLGEFARNFQRERDINYTRDRNIDYARNFVGDFQGDFLGEFSRNFHGDFLGNFTGDFTGNFVRYRVTSSSYVGTQYYLGGYLRNRDVNYTRDRNVNRSATYQRDRETNRDVNYARDFVGDFTGDYVGDFLGEFARNFQRTRVSNYTGEQEYSRTFEGEFEGNYTRSIGTGNFLGDYLQDYVGNYQGDYTTTYEGNYSRDFTGDYVGTRIGTGTTNIETYTLYVKSAD